MSCPPGARSRARAPVAQRRATAGLADASVDRYSSVAFSSRYLDAEWTDLLFPGRLAGRLFADQGFGPGRFYLEVAELTRDWAKATGCEVSRVCDVGGATGRMSLELTRRFPALADQVMVEPSGELCRWARRLLLQAAFDGWIPLPGDCGQPEYVRLDPDWMPEAVAVSIHRVTAARVPRPAGYFDLITCLNVADRVPNPAALVRALRRLLRPSGLLVLASAHHYEETFTPRERWVEDLGELLDPAEWDVADRIRDVGYGFLRYSRGGVWYSSQVAGAVRR